MAHKNKIRPRSEGLAKFSFGADMLKRAKRKASDIIDTVASAVLWEPRPQNKPQIQAYESPADRLFYGGAAGGGSVR